MNVLYISGTPSPYRVDLFNEMGKAIHLTVLFLAEYLSDRNKLWQSSEAENYSSVFLNKGALNGSKVDFGVVKYLKKHATDFDVIVVHGYSFVASILAICWLKCHRINYFIEADGAIIPKKERLYKAIIKRFCIKNASFCLSSGKITTDFFVHYGALKEKCINYPFSSISREDIVSAKKFSKNEKALLRKDLGIKGDKVVMVLGNTNQLNDILSEFETMNNTNSGSFGLICFDSFISSETKCNSGIIINNIENMDKSRIYQYLAASDLVVLLSPIGESYISIYEMCLFGLPVVTCEGYLSLDSLIKHGRNGIIVKSLSDVIPSLIDLLNNENRLIEYSENCIIDLLECNQSLFSESNSQLFIDALVAIRQIHKQLARIQLNVGSDKRIVLYIGQMIYRKGIDVLLKSKKLLPSDICFFLIGGMVDSNLMPSIDFLSDKSVCIFDFMVKDQLRMYYHAADVFVLPTREDIWGLVINEALNYGIPIVSTNGCVAACELLPEENISPIEDEQQLASRILCSLNTNNNMWQIYAINKTLEYSMECSSRIHVCAFDKSLSR